jgi:hypothetical protein
LATATLSSSLGATPLDDAIEQIVAANVVAAQSQASVEKLADETTELSSQYRATLEETESIRVYNAQIEGLVRAQEEEVASLRQQIDNVTVVARELTPMMLRMLDALEQFVALDVPFLEAERRDRLGKLRAMMQRADVTDAEKYRRIIEAFQIENDYGRTIEAYKGQLGEGATARTVNFLRVGRIIFLYQTLDEKEAAAWSQESHSFVPLPADYRTTLHKGFQMARKQAAPDLLGLPVPAPRRAP